jgi:hypothetical protein
MTRLALLLLVMVSLLVAAAPALADCMTVNAKYPHGIAKNFKVIKTANGLTGRPFVSAKLYAKGQTGSHPTDRDKDGVACEK